MSVDRGPAGGGPAPGAPQYQGAPVYQGEMAPPVPDVALAAWPQRARAFLIDVMIVAVPGGAISGVYAAATASDGPTRSSSVVLAVGSLIGLVLWIWNRGVRQGAGQSIGKGMVGLRLVSEETRQPIGTAMALVRDVVHLLDSSLFLLGYLWPLWDPKKQTFADKIVRTISVRA
ncbi:RDD family protein [Isoptericola sp. b490]|nr:RDD family protein [Isoptericola sp. b490]